MTDNTLPMHIVKRNIMLLVVAQAFLGAQMSAMFIVGGLSGLMLAPNKCLATLPISFIILGSMLTAPRISNYMQTHGRRRGFWIGTLGGGMGAAFCAYALYINSFYLFLFGSLLSGIYMSSQGFFRFAATDSTPKEYQPKAISWVMAGGLLSAVIGPQIVKLTSDSYVISFMGVYITVVFINLIGSLIFIFLDIPTPEAKQKYSSLPRTKRQLLADPTILVAIICATVSYALMNLVMTSTPLAIIGCGYTPNDAADVVAAHVLAMFAPSFITGPLIIRYGSTRIISIGLILLAVAGLIALSGVKLSNFYGALIILGIGFNFGFIGATALLTSAQRPEEKGVLQGMNDMIVFGFVTLISLVSGLLMNCSGGNAIEGWNAVNIAMVPFLLLAAVALIWLNLKKLNTPAN